MADVGLHNMDAKIQNVSRMTLLIDFFVVKVSIY